MNRRTFAFRRASKSRFAALGEHFDKSACGFAGPSPAISRHRRTGTGPLCDRLVLAAAGVKRFSGRRDRTFSGRGITRGGRATAGCGFILNYVFSAGGINDSCETCSARVAMVRGWPGSIADARMFQRLLVSTSPACDFRIGGSENPRRWRGGAAKRGVWRRRSNFTFWILSDRDRVLRRWLRLRIRQRNDSRFSRGLNRSASGSGSMFFGLRDPATCS